MEIPGKLEYVLSWYSFLFHVPIFPDLLHILKYIHDTSGHLDRLTTIVQHCYQNIVFCRHGMAMKFPSPKCLALKAGE